MCEVLISAQQNQFVPDAKLRDERIDCADLHPSSTAQVSEAGGRNVVFAFWLDQCERREALDNLLACLGACEALKEFLQDEASGNDNVCSGERFLERLHLRFLNFNVASER